MILTNSPADIGLGEAGIYALLGYAVVFFGLSLLLLVVVLMGKAFMSSAKKKAIPTATLTEIKEFPCAPGTAGNLKLYNVDPKTAAMLMAIVADKMKKPINELRFLSIKEVSQ